MLELENGSSRLALISALMIYQVLEAARDKFTREISFQSKDKDISLAKVTIPYCSVCRGHECSIG